jgi:tetratricopeptide (TPR) repeat protein
VNSGDAELALLGRALLGCALLGCAAGREPAAPPAEPAPAWSGAMPCPPGAVLGATAGCATASVGALDASVLVASDGAAPPGVEDEEPLPPRPPDGLARGTGDALDRELRFGDEAFDVDDLARARKHYEKARRLAPKDPAPQLGLLRVRFALSGAATGYASAPNDKRVAAIARELEALTRLDAGFGPAFLELGRVALVLGDAPRALAALERGVALRAGDPEAQSALGIAYLATGDARRALARLKLAARIEPSAERLANLGTAFMMRGQVEDAVRAYERAVELAPSDPRAHGDLGTAYLAANRADEAVRHLRRAVELAPDRATFWSNLGYAQQLGGRLDEAIATYRKALALDSRLGSAWINLATALARQGKLDEAQAALDRAFAIDPNDPRAQANQTELDDLRRKRIDGGA